MKIETKLLSHEDIDDFKELLTVFIEVFEMENFIQPDNSHLRNILSNPNFLTLVAKAGNKVVGGLTVYIIDQYYSHKPLAYIYDLAVLKAFQRQGIGKTLITYLTEYCKEHGFEEVFVQADRIDDYALDFYRSTNPTGEEDVIHFHYLL